MAIVMLDLEPHLIEDLHASFAFALTPVPLYPLTPKKKKSYPPFPFSANCISRQKIEP